MSAPAAGAGWAARALGRLRPRTLAGQTMLLVGATLLLVQMLAFASQVAAARNQWLTITVAPAVIRVLEAAEPRLPQRPSFARRVVETPSRPAALGEERPELAARARDIMANAGMQVMAVHAVVLNDPAVRQGKLRRLMNNQRRPGWMLLRLSVQVSPQRWLSVQVRSPPAPPPPILNLVLQTMVLYAATLLPLMWLARRLSEPLHELTEAAGRVGSRQTIAPLKVRGSDDLKELGAAFNAMQARIAAMLAEKDHMLGAIGHDLRTPLASLRLRVESVRSAKERNKMIATIDEMRKMLDDILVLARIGREREAAQRFDLADMAEAVVDDLVELGKPVSLTRAERAILLAHPRAIRRALTNLADNAVKYGEQARVSVRVDGDEAVLAVEDDGPGIAPDQVEDMLQPFTRLENSRSRETGGAGLGLAIVRAIASAEGGRIVLGNRPEGGLVAELRLPLAT